MLQTMGSWASIICLVITVFTLLMTLNIRGKIDRSLGKQRFLQQREKIVAEFNTARMKLKYAEGDEQAVSASLLELRAMTLQLDHYRIWRSKDWLKLRKFIKFFSRTYSGQKQATAKELMMRIDEIIVIVKSQAEV